ncbi:MAG: mandelate racemase, partial [Chloroflexi bacterium]|nr:mandelate racemase [Chloroflexota bacterium]
MPNYPVIDRIEITRYLFPWHDVGDDLNFAVGPFYEKGSERTRRLLGIKIFTDEGVTGEFMSSAPGTYEQMQAVAPLLIGANALEREKFYNVAKTHLRKNDRMGIGPLDITLWDLAGKAAGKPVYELLGGPVKPYIPVYASALHPVGAEKVQAEAKAYVEEGYQAMKMRFPYGPGHGIAGMRANEEHVANVRDAV